MTFSRLKRRSHKGRMNSVKETGPVRSRPHLQWIRLGFPCSVQCWSCQGEIEAAHVRRGTDGGTGMKPGDNWAIPLCSAHHAAQHAVGEETFESVHKIDMKAIAQDLARRSPHLRKLERSK